MKNSEKIKESVQEIKSKVSPVQWALIEPHLTIMLEFMEEKEKLLTTTEIRSKIE